MTVRLQPAKRDMPLYFYRWCPLTGRFLQHNSWRRVNQIRLRLVFERNLPSLQGLC